MTIETSRQRSAVSLQADDTVTYRPITKVANRGVTNLATLATSAGDLKNAVPEEEGVRNLLCPAPTGQLRGKRFLTPLSSPNVRITKALK
jgi:hypothetical protein